MPQIHAFFRTCSPTQSTHFCGGVVVGQDQAGIGLAALQGDADGHLVDGAASQGVGAGQGLGAEQDMDAKGPALAHQPIQNLAGLGGGGVVFGEEFLEFIDQQEDAGKAPPPTSGEGSLAR